MAAIRFPPVSVAVSSFRYWGHRGRCFPRPAYLFRQTEHLLNGLSDGSLVTPLPNRERVPFERKPLITSAIPPTDFSLALILRLWRRRRPRFGACLVRPFRHASLYFAFSFA